MKCVHLDQVDKLNLTCLIQEFIYEQQPPSSNAHDIANLPQFYEKITIHTTAIATFHAPSNLSGIGGMKCECIHAVAHWQKCPGHYNTMFINTASNNTSNNNGDSAVCRILSLDVAQAHLFFSFALDGVKYQCALVHWFSHTIDMPHNVTGIHAVKPDCLPNSQPSTAVILSSGWCTPSQSFLPIQLHQNVNALNQHLTCSHSSTSIDILTTMHSRY